VTISSGILSYSVDTIRRRMMMTSGQAVKYKGSIECTVQIVKKEGAMSLFKGAGANILHGVAGAGVLAGFDSFKKVYIGAARPPEVRGASAVAQGAPVRVEQRAGRAHRLDAAGQDQEQPGSNQRQQTQRSRQWRWRSRKQFPADHGVLEV